MPLFSPWLFVARETTKGPRGVHSLQMATDHNYCASVQRRPHGAQYCCVCKNWRGKIVSGTKVSLHRFPADKKVRNVWNKRVKLAMVSGFVVTTNSRLCSLHFDGLAGPKPPKITIPSLFPNKTYQTTTVSLHIIFFFWSVSDVQWQSSWSFFVVFFSVSFHRHSNQ